MSIWRRWKGLRTSLRAATSVLLAAAVAAVLALAGVIPGAMWTFVASTLTVVVVFVIYSAFVPRSDVLPTDRDEPSATEQDAREED